MTPATTPDHHDAARRLERAAIGWVVLLAIATVALALFIWPPGWLLVTAVAAGAVALTWLGHAIASVLVVAARDRGRARKHSEP